jgi:hypothetical protein
VWLPRLRLPQPWQRLAWLLVLVLALLPAFLRCQLDVPWQQGRLLLQAGVARLPPSMRSVLLRHCCRW